MKHNHTIHQHQCHFGWSNANPPVVRIAPGETIEFHPLDSSGGQITAQSTLDERENIREVALWDFEAASAECNGWTAKGAKARAVTAPVCALSVASERR